MFIFDRITTDPDLLEGAPCIRGMRVSVALITNLSSHGMTTDEIIAEYPDLEPDDIVQALQYDTRLVEDNDR